MKTYDTIILGGGTIGLAAAYYAAAAGQKTLLLEKNSFFNQVGSSSGYSRIFRTMYSEENMAKLAETSYALWKQIERFTGETLVEEMPLLFFGTKDLGQTVEGDFKNTDRIMSRLGMPYERLNDQDLLRRYPMFKEIPENYTGLLQLNSGIAHVQRSLRTFYSLAVKAGAVLKENSPSSISDCRPGARDFVVRSSDGDFRAQNLILAPGAWTNEVLRPFGLQFDFKIWQMSLAYFQVDGDATNFPLWYEFGKEGCDSPALYYGFPSRENPGSIKVSADFTHDIYDDVQSCSRIPDQKILQSIGEFLERRFRGVSPKPHNASTCLYTMSADAHMILGSLPGFANVAILTGESGRAFKYTPLFGRILAELAREGRTSYDLSGISIDRPNLFREQKV